MRSARPTRMSYWPVAAMAWWCRMPAAAWCGWAPARHALSRGCSLLPISRPACPASPSPSFAAVTQVGRFVQAHLHNTSPHLLAGVPHVLQELLAPGQHADTRLHAAAAVGAHLLAERSGIELASVTGVL
jgi:hypothetical protein